MHADRQLLAEPQLLEHDAEGEHHRPGGDQRAAVRRRAQEVRVHERAIRLRAAEPLGCGAMTDLVLTDDRGAVRHVVLNRPEKRNAFNLELIARLDGVLQDVADDPSVHCVVLRGEGRCSRRAST